MSMHLDGSVSIKSGEAAVIEEVIHSLVSNNLLLGDVQWEWTSEQEKLANPENLGIVLVTLHTASTEFSFTTFDSQPAPNEWFDVASNWAVKVAKSLPVEITVTYTYYKDYTLQWQLRAHGGSSWYSTSTFDVQDVMYTTNWLRSLPEAQDDEAPKYGDAEEIPF